MKPYPIFLNDLSKRRCVVIGGGGEAERKVKDLLDCEAMVVLISPEATDLLQEWAKEGQISWWERAYQPGDLKGAFLVIVSETNPVATEPIWQEAQAERVLINAMDDVAHCSFVAGSVVRRGPLVLSISTSGQAPALSVRLRQRLEQLFDPSYAGFVELLGRLREPMAVCYPDFEERRRLWYALVDADLLDLLRRDDLDTTYGRIGEIAGEEVRRAIS